MLTHAKLVLADVLGQLDTAGISLSHVPSIKLKDRLPYWMMECDVNPTGYRRPFGKVDAIELQVLYDKLFGLRISNVAAMVTMMQANMEFGHKGDDREILATIDFVSGRDGLRFNLFHALWHLVDEEHGFSVNDSCLSNGVATFVQNYLAGSSIKWSGIRPKDAEYLTHEYAASLMVPELEKSGNPLTQLIDPEFRRRLESTVGAHIEKFYRVAIRKEVNRDLELKSRRECLSNHPAYASFRKNPCRRGLLRGLRLRGLEHIAQEIEGQNMERMIEFVREAVAN